MPNSSWIRVAVAVAALVSLAAVWFRTGEWQWDSARFTISGSSVAILVLLAYDRSLWRWPLVRRLTARPVLHGTWKAELCTSYSERANEVIECYMTIRQTYSSIQIDMLFEHSRSRHLSGGLTQEGGRTQLQYLFWSESDALHRDGNPPARGAAVLTVARHPRLHLGGDYWMERGTTGTLRTTDQSPEIIESFQAARAHFGTAD